jgi:hypothetical protein
MSKVTEEREELKHITKNEYETKMEQQKGLFLGSNYH